MTPTDYRRIAAAFATLAEMFDKMAGEHQQAPTTPKAEYVNKTDAARILGCSPATIRNRIAEGLLTEYPAGLKIAELKAYAEGTATKPAKDYRIESPRARAVKGG